MVKMVHWANNVENHSVKHFYHRRHTSIIYAIFVCLPQVGVLLKQLKRRITQTMAHDSPRTLVFCCQISQRNSTGVTLTEVPNADGVG